MNRYSNLTKVVHTIKPQAIMEIGTWNGVNASKMITTALQYHKTVEYLGFDLFEKFAGLEKEEYCPKKPASYKEVLKKLNAIPGCTPRLIFGNTKETLAAVVDPTPADLIFIDGGHSIETIKSDWDNCQRYCKQGTVILLDDYYYDARISIKYGCRQLVDSLAGKGYNIHWLTPIDPVNGGTAIVQVSL